MHQQLIVFMIYCGQKVLNQGHKIVICPNNVG